MANPVDDAPISSYSDPIYDRLEVLSHTIRRNISLFIAGLLIVLMGAFYVYNRSKDTPLAGSAVVFMKAGEDRDPVKSAEAYGKMVADPATVPLFRARACIELAQIALDGNKIDEARKHIEQAASIATTLDNLDLTLGIQLSRAAVDLQAGDAAKAETTYLKVERDAGAKYPDRLVAAVLGAAMAQEKLGKLDEAIAKLEPVVNRADLATYQQQGKVFVLKVAQAQYWRLKRLQSEKVAAPATEIKPTADMKPATDVKPADVKPTDAAAVTPAAPAAPATTPVPAK